MTKRVDINVDIGEGFPFDEDLLDFATSANVCCGEHAGSWELTKETVFLCRLKEVRIGMHPGFPDRDSMGRARMQEDEVAQYANSIFEQALRFREYASEVAYLKPHGAWYNMLSDWAPPNAALHQAVRLILDGTMAAVQIPVMLLARTEWSGLDPSQVIREGFADRGYDAHFRLLPRSEPGAVLTNKEQISAQVLNLARSVDSICIHGDSPGCLEIARLVYAALEQNGYEVGY